jgi:hypothetical protein
MMGQQSAPLAANGKVETRSIQPMSIDRLGAVEHILIWLFILYPRHLLHLFPSPKFLLLTAEQQPAKQKSELNVAVVFGPV